MVGFLLPLAPRAQADTEVSLNLFYDNLSTQGDWIEVTDYGYCFQPNVAVSNADWRPYSDGYWAYTDVGWTWVSYEDFGWATYHYGRWANLDSYGWVWVPGYEWAPAWVSWRTGGDYVGWAPLPPAGERVYEGQAITGQVDVEFGIGPLYYNFVDVRYIGEPVLRGRILPPARNVTIINNTVNVTNITYSNSVVYNYGPDYNRLNQYSTRPVQRLTLQRETTVGANLGEGRKGNFNRVSGNQLTVVAPTIQKSQQQIAPKQVKAKVPKANLQTGWKGIDNRQQVEAEMKKGDPKNIPAPDFQPQKGRKAEAVAGAQQGGEQPPQNAAGQQQDSAAKGANAADQQAQQTQQNDQAARRAEAQKSREENQNRKNRRGQADTARETPAPVAAQPEATQKPEQAQPAEPPRPGRAERGAERRAPRAEQNGQQQASPDQGQGADRAREARKPQRPEESQPADNGRPDNNRPPRAQQAPEAPAAPAADDNSGRPARPEQQANRPERAPRQVQERPPQQEQARPPRQPREQQPGNDNPDNERKGKKKKPAEEPSPRP